MVLLVTTQIPAASKGLQSGPVAVMKPDGQVFILRGSRAKTFVREANSLQSDESSDSPEAAALVAGGPVSGATAEHYLVAFQGWGGGVDFNWTAAAWFYPSTKEEPAYLVWPMAIGDERGAWADWQEATPRMERIVLGGGPIDAVLPFTGSSSPLWLLAGTALALAGAGTILMRLSRYQLRARSNP